MSILFVLMMFLVVMIVSYFLNPESHRATVRPALATHASPQHPRMQSEMGFQVPAGYSFHPGHTWALKEGPDTVRVGIDAFATNLLGKIDGIQMIGTNRWVRQGQKLMTVHSGDSSVELLSPIEGMVAEVNQKALEDPKVIGRDPYKDGWIAMVKAPDLAINQKNLVQGAMVAPWLQNNVSRLSTMLAPLSPALAQDGGLPVEGLLKQLPHELRQQVIASFFLN